MLTPGPEASLDAWLAYLRDTAHAAMDLGLARCRAVAERLAGGCQSDSGSTRDSHRKSGVPLPFVTVAVAGTNGKGSSVKLAEQVLLSSGRSVGAFYSPPLDDFNETITVNGEPLPDAAIISAFAQVEAARDDTPLTPFEVHALAAVQCFRAAGVDVSLLEIGLGGRLDAVNVFAFDAGLVTNIGLDHQHWLGDSRDAIGVHKGGIARARKPLVCGDPMPPAGLLETVLSIDADLVRRGRDFDLTMSPESSSGDVTLHWRGLGWSLPPIRCTRALAPMELDNAAGVFALVHLLDPVKVDANTLEQGLAAARLAGRQQVLSAPDAPVLCIVDVAHNADAVRALHDSLATPALSVSGRTLAVVAMLADKDAAAVSAEIGQTVDAWYLAGTPGPRGQDVTALAEGLMLPAGATVSRHATVAEAYTMATAKAAPGDRVVAFGSFHAAREVRASVNRCILEN